MRAILSSLAAAVLAGCVVYAPPPGMSSNYDRAWSAALGAAQDAGVSVYSADESAGLIRGTREGMAVTVAVARRADGSVQVKFDAEGPSARDPSLAARFSDAYDRRMGR